MSDTCARRAVARAVIELMNAEIPEGTGWIAQDADGEWFAYRSRPKHLNCVWISTSSTTCQHCIGYGAPPVDFAREIYEI